MTTNKPELRWTPIVEEIAYAAVKAAAEARGIIADEACAVAAAWGATLRLHEIVESQRAAYESLGAAPVPVRTLTCGCCTSGCCTSGCCCAHHQDVPMGRPATRCHAHGAAT